MSGYKCNKCGKQVEADEVEDSQGNQVQFSCPNGCGETVEEVEDAIE